MKRVRSGKMIKMIIADDEPVIVAGIQKLVDWEGLGIEIAGQYTDGKSALEGIIAHEPDIVLLDISMPGMTGVEILKECRLLGLLSKVVLISGFQDFEYAKAGIQYGAVDYLLKPVIRDELLRAIDKSISQREQELWREPEKTGASEDYRGLLPLEEGPYLPVYVAVFLEEENRQMERLTRFSVLSFMESWLEEQDLGIAFTKKENLVVVFKGLSQKEGEQAAILLTKEIEGRFGCPAGAVVGRPVEQMSKIPEEFQECLYMREYFFFRDQMALPVLLVGENVFTALGGNSHLLALRSQMIDLVVAQEKEKLQKGFGQFTKAVCRMADGKREDALFYLCSAVRVLDEKFRGLALPHPDYDEKELLQKGRECRDYGELQEVFYGIVLEYLEKLKTSMVNSSSRDFLKAKVYIDEHYDENLTLEVLAGEVHMNPYYFSSFFKKNAGENFKDYLSRVRVQHAVSLLVSTDMKSYEIALKVGFNDARGFSENFQRIYHETPAAYRKRVKKGGENR